MTDAKHNQEQEEAHRFVDAFGGKKTFQWFGEESGCSVRPGHETADFEEIRPKLVELNEQGAGIFLMPNEGDGKGRKNSNLTRIRTVFVDLDGASLATVMGWRLKPHIVVESSPGRWHCYWLTSDVPTRKFRRIQEALANRFGGDPKVKDLCRVMRVPGFFTRRASRF